MVIIPWNGLDYHEKSDICYGNHSSEMEAFNRGTFSTGDMNPWVVPMENGIDSDLLSDNILASVRNKCINKIVNEGQIVENYFEAIYERNQALELAADAAKKILEFLVNFRKPKYWKGIVKRQPSDIPEAWLTYNFGVKPLISTIDSAMKLLSKPYPSIIIKGGSGTDFNATMIKESPGIKDTYFGHGKYFQQIRAHVHPHSNPNAALANIVGLSTPFSTAMSVLPWGWAVDYFVNASELISNMEDKFPGIYFESIWETVSWSVDFGTVRYNTDLEKEDGMNYGKAHNFYRQPTGLNYSLEFSFPRLSGNQFANLASAIALTLKGKH